MNKINKCEIDVIKSWSYPLYNIFNYRIDKDEVINYHRYHIHLINIKSLNTCIKQVHTLEEAKEYCVKHANQKIRILYKKIHNDLILICNHNIYSATTTMKLMTVNENGDQRYNCTKCSGV